MGTAEPHQERQHKRSCSKFIFQRPAMVKLTPDIIEGAGQYINPIRDRELDLRGYKIPVIENLGAALDQYDCIDFSDNEIRKLDGFPYMGRVKSLMLNNNRIVRVGEGLELCLPNLNTLILTNNSLQELADLEPLTSLTKLEFLSLLHNPVVTKRNYREYVIHKFPNLRVLDFKKIKQKEREAAKSLYKSKEGKTQLKDIERKAKTFVPGEPLPEATNKNTNAAGLTPDQVPQRGGETDTDAEGRPDAGHGDPEWIRGDGTV